MTGQLKPLALSTAPNGLVSGPGRGLYNGQQLPRSAANAIPERKPPDVIRFLADETPAHPVYLTTIPSTPTKSPQEYGVRVRAGVCNPPAQSLAESRGICQWCVNLGVRPAPTACGWGRPAQAKPKQWEKAASPSANPSRYPWGTTHPAKQPMCRVPMASSQWGASRLGQRPTGQDMAGNVCEVYDYYAEVRPISAGGRRGNG